VTVARRSRSLRDKSRAESCRTSRKPRLGPPSVADKTREFSEPRIRISLAEDTAVAPASGNGHEPEAAIPSQTSPPPAARPDTSDKSAPYRSRSLRDGTYSGARDLELVEQLIERCRREIDTADLNVKLIDLVRLLEFKTKLRPSVDAERAFWTMIDQMRHEELGSFGEPDLADSIPIARSPSDGAGYGIDSSTGHDDESEADGAS
jgi:hypothetical protein